MGIDLDFYLRIVQESFPQLEISSIRFIGGGSFRVFETDSGLIFRFPHSTDGAALLRQERRVSECLQPLLSLPIPRYEYFAQSSTLFDNPVAGYHKLPGIALENCRLNGTAMRTAATQIGAFLTELHGTLPAPLEKAQLPTSDPQNTRARLWALHEQIRQIAFPILSSEEKEWTDALFQAFLTEKAHWKYEPVPIHGDFDSSNILVDPPSGEITAILDWEEARLDDPALDFCVLAAEFGSQFLEWLLSAYGRKLDSDAAQRIAFHARRIIYHELLYGIEHDAPRFTNHGLARLRRAIAGREPIGGWLIASTSETRSESHCPA